MRRDCSSFDRSSGFSLIELLIVVAIIGLIAGMIVPNLFDAMMKAKQKKTVAEIRITGTAMMLWLSDEASASAAGSVVTVDLGNYDPISEAELSVQLVPEYVSPMPTTDGWKRPYDFYLNVDTPLARHVMAIRSAGRGQTPDGDVYTSGPYSPTDYDRDIVWTDGFFVRWPDKLT
jgi:prepilin-type N-terminal cleavage/methylation domain-containing protein